MDRSREAAGAQADGSATDGSTRTSLVARVAFAVVALSIAGRAVGIAKLPALSDYDGAGHALNVAALYDGRLPEPSSWSGFHPPLFHAVGALALRIAPEAVPAHVVLRVLSLAAALGTVLLTWRFLRARCGRDAAAVATAVAACSPVFFVASSMLGNETTCTFFVTAALAALARPASGAAAPALLAGLAALSKATGLLVVPVVALAQALRPGRPAQRIGALALACAIPLALVGPFYASVALRTGVSPLAVVSGGALSPDAAEEMSHQPPGYRRLAHYTDVPATAVLHPTTRDPALLRSVTALLYASAWADPHGQFLPVSDATISRAGAPSALAGLVPTLLAISGIGAILLAPRRYAFALPGTLFLGVLLAAFVQYTWSVPTASAVKASYLLPAFLPAATALAVGTDRLIPVARRIAQWLLLATAAVTTAAFSLAWWL